MIAKNITGDYFKISKTFLGTFNRVTQDVCVSSKIKTGQMWYIHSGELVTASSPIEEYLDRWKLKSVRNISKDIKTLIFKKEEEKKFDEEDERNTRELIMGLNLNDDDLNLLIRTILLHVFKPKFLKKLLDAEKIEFIIDELWMYLRCGNTAYRI